VERSGELVDLVRDAIPAAARTAGGNPAKRTFQALRIAVNRELDLLERAMPAAIEHVAVGGRIVVLAYHSLEDRIVKHSFAAGAESTAPPGMPVVPDHAQPYLRLLTRGAEKANQAEIADNSRAKSVRLRAVERSRATPVAPSSRWAA
jgi:16S rRNA (cytosine1402-N4)-methyltransferase